MLSVFNIQEILIDFRDFNFSVYLFFLLQNKEGDANLQTALQNPKAYVLKPQREGGGKLLSLMLNLLRFFVLLMVLYY